MIKALAHYEENNGPRFQAGQFARKTVSATVQVLPSSPLTELFSTDLQLPQLVLLV